MSYANFVKTLVTVPVTIGATSITLITPVSPFVLPPVDGGTLVLSDSASNPTVVEIVTYTSRAGNVLSGVTRAQEGTAARAWSGNVYCYQPITAGTYVADFATKEPTIAADSVTKFWSGTKTWRDLGSDIRSTLVTGYSAVTGSAVVATDTILAAINKLQGQISSFNGSNISSGTVAAARVATLNQSTTGNAATATTAASCSGNAASASGVAWGGVSGTPTTLGGYGISDAAASSHTHSYAPLTGGGTSGSWPISVTGSSSSCTGNAATATSATDASKLPLSGGTLTGPTRGTPAALTWGATVTPDFSVSNNFTVTLGGATTLANPTNQVAGQSGFIVVKQDATGSRTLAYGANWWFKGVAPVLSITASSTSVLYYTVLESGLVHGVLVSP